MCFNRGLWRFQHGFFKKNSPNKESQNFYASSTIPLWGYFIFRGCDLESNLIQHHLKWFRFRENWKVPDLDSKNSQTAISPAKWVSIQHESRTRRDQFTDPVRKGRASKKRYRYKHLPGIVLHRIVVSQAWYSTGPNDGILGIHWPFGWRCLNLGAPITVSETRSKTKIFPGTDHQQTRQRIFRAEVKVNTSENIRKPMGFSGHRYVATPHLCPSIRFQGMIMIYHDPLRWNRRLVLLNVLLHHSISINYIYIYKYPQFSQFFTTHV